MIKTASHNLIGPAARVLSVLRTKAARLAAKGEPVKALLTGPMGTGKTDLALRFALEFTGSDLNVENVNGKEISVEYVRELKARVHQKSLFGTGKFAIVADECDKMTADARDMLLSVLDQLPAHCAFIGTSNLNLAASDKMEVARFQSRLHCLEVPAPDCVDIAALIASLVPDVPEPVALTIAGACEGCVRSAIIDAENYQDTLAAAA